MKPLELKEIFGKKAIQTMCTEKTDELSTIIRQLNNELDKWYKKLASSKNEDSWWFESWIDMKKLQIKNRKAEQGKWERLYKQVKDYKKTDGIYSTSYADVLTIKNRVLIGDLLGQPDWSDAKRAKYKCPLHDEKTASFVVYLDQNSWYCYGECAKGGDCIELYMAMNNCDFKTALRSLADF